MIYQKKYFFFQNYDKYAKYKQNQKYPTLKSKTEYVKEKLQTVNTIPERIICDYLYIHNIKYRYKEQYPFLEQYYPDITIYYENEIYYIEYINIEIIKKYKNEKDIKQIRKIHKKYKTNLIEIYNGNIIEDLEKELKNRNIKLNEININEIFNQLIKKQDISYKRFIKFCAQFISLFKSKGCKEEDLNQIKYNTKRENIFKEFIKKLYNYYQKTLKEKNMLDFDDIINNANEIIKHKEKINLKYKYIIIDEFQDISECRFKLIKNISKKLNTKIMVVGDDWQCIYSFASSNINLFTQFKKNVEYCEIQKIVKTYRNSQELIDIAGKFIEKNKNQIKKQLTSNKKLKNPITIISYKTNQIKKTIKETIKYIIKKYGAEKNILILGRYTFDKNKIIDDELKEINNEIIYKNNPQIKIDYMTIHSSKGLGYDNVILINAIDDTLGFPSKIKIDPIIEPLLTKETIKYEEERRLFYVALTRTKNEVIILTPKYNSSIFVKEIKKYKNIRIKNKIIK